ncbi:hypothetical protein HN51_044599 [Arachis hypogaea]|nr:uncharacterized protein DS421_18g622280 [Arachis hypogaea]
MTSSSSSSKTIMAMPITINEDHDNGENVFLSSRRSGCVTPKTKRFKILEVSTKSSPPPPKKRRVISTCLSKSPSSSAAAFFSSPNIELFFFATLRIDFA